MLFDERLSERGFSETLFVVSPLDGGMRIERDGAEIRIAIDGGWRPDRIYRLVLLPGLRDLFGNARAEPVELVFSTGPPVPQTAIAGIVLDRITGSSAVSPVVEAVRRADTARYMAIADSGGFYALRHLPAGVYDMHAYADANRNRRRDPAEPVDSGHVASLTADTITQIFHVLSPDSTGPVVLRASVVDSLHVRIALDDYVTAEAAAAASAAVLLLPDSAQFASAEQIWLEPQFRTQLRATPVAVDTAGADTTGVAVDTTDIAAAQRMAAAAAAAAEAAAADSAAARRGPQLPARELVIRLDRTLLPGAEYVVVVRGLVNLYNLGGGGSATFESPAAPVPRPAAADSSQAGLRR